MKKIILFLITVMLFQYCSTVPITGRKRFNIISDAQVLPTAFAQYKGFLAENKLSTNVSKTNQIKSVGRRISAAVDKFMRLNGMSSEADSYKWEFNLVEDQTVNAWCMPGGKVIFYTGILPMCANEDGIAAVMGHEIAHAFAKHGQERMSQGTLQQLGGVAVALGTANKSGASRQIFYTAYGVGSNLGMLAYSRKHETEADKLGLVFMIMAGYNPKEAVNVWVRMKKNSGGQPPEFLSTHPSHDTRIETLTKYIPEATILANKYKSQTVK